MKSTTAGTGYAAVVAGEPFAWRPVGGVAALLATTLGATIGRYDYHRDELYFRLLAEHPGWGYVDQPPATPLIAGASRWLFGDTVWALRLPALLCVVVTAFLAAAIARELGGGRWAQTLAAAGLISVFPLVVGHVLLTASLDLPVWTGVTLLVMRALLRAQPRWWLAAGALVGLGLYNKHLVILLLVGLGAGLLAVGPRRALASPWPWAGAVLALLIGAPNVAYQVVNGFPQLDMAAALADDRGDEARVLFLPMQLVIVGVPLVPIWAVGLLALWRRPAWRPVRALAVAYPVVCLLLLAAAGQFYYTMGLVLTLYAAGCVVVVPWLSRGAVALRRLVVAVGLAVNMLLSVLTALPVLPRSVLADTPVPAMNQTIRDQVGWESYVRQVGDAYHRLSPADRARTVIITSNYGEAGAIDRYGERYGLPAVYSGHNELYRHGPPPPAAEIALLVIQGDAPGLRDAFDSCEVVGRLDNGIGVDNEEQGTRIRVCRGPRAPWPQLWPRFHHLS